LQNPDVVLLDLNWGRSLHDYTGIEIEENLRKIDPSVTTIAFSAYLKQPEYKKKLAEESNFDYKINKSDIELEKSNEILQQSAKLSMIRKGYLNLETLSLDFFNNLTIKLKREVAKKIRTINRTKLKTAFNNYEWIVMMANEIINKGRYLLSNQDKQELEKWRRQIEHKNQLPTFYFLRPPIVESIDWRMTRGDDYYPNIELVILDNKTSIKVKGDFDTGSERTFISDALLSDDNNLEHDVHEVDFGGINNYSEKSLMISLHAKEKTKNIIISTLMNIGVVEGWEKSGFIHNYPKRELLIGRDLIKHFPHVSFVLNWNKKRTILIAEED
jgi:hypothetical protein